MNDEFENHIKTLAALLSDAGLPASQVLRGQTSLNYILKNFRTSSNANRKGGTSKLEKKKVETKKVRPLDTIAKVVMNKIDPLFNMLIEQNIYIEDTKLSLFHIKTEDFLLQVPDQEWLKDSGIRFLSDLLSLLTKIKHMHDHIVFKELKIQLSACIEYVVDLLEKRDVVVLPKNMDNKEIEWESKDFTYCCSLKPKGYLLSIKTFTLKKGEKLLSPGEVVISCGYKSQVFEYIKNLEYVLLKNRDKFYSEYWNNNLKKFNSWCNLISKDKNYEKEENYKYLRYAIQTFFNIDLPEVKKYIEKAKHLLDKIGIEIINIDAGTSLRKLKLKEDFYDIKEVESDERKGKVLKLVSPGFVKDDGVVLQKAVVQVSKGRTAK